MGGRDRPPIHPSEESQAGGRKKQIGDEGTEREKRKQKDTHGRRRPRDRRKLQHWRG